MRMNCANDKSGCKAKCCKIALMVIVGTAALGWLVMLLWNWLMPELFAGARPIGYWQALGVFALSKILFGGHGYARWKERRQYWESMTPEEREQLKSHFKRRWGHWCHSDRADDKSASIPTSDAE